MYALRRLPWTHKACNNVDENSYEHPHGRRILITTYTMHTLAGSIGSSEHQLVLLAYSILLINAYSARYIYTPTASSSRVLYCILDPLLVPYSIVQVTNA